MATLSACLVVWNGEKLIRDCLESLKSVVDDIVVVHDGPCSDRTLQICRKYTRKVYVRPRVGEAEPHRPFSFAKASGDWILWIDQDERLTPALRKNIRKLIARKDVDAYTFRWPVKYCDANLTKGNFSRVQKRALFRKSAITRFHGLPNETVQVKGKVVDTNYRLIHIQEGERGTLRAFFKRDVRITRIHADQLIKKKLATKPALWYLLKAPLWFLLYLGYYYVLMLAFFTKADISTSFQHALYNLLLYWHVFLGKLGVKLTS